MVARRRCGVVAGALAVALCLATLAAQGCGIGASSGAEGPGTAARPLFSNIVNEPFATIASGPMDALFVDDGATRVGARAAIGEKHPGVESLYNRLVSYGVKWADFPPMLARRIIHVNDGELVLPNRAEVRQSNAPVGNGTLTFTYENWSADQQSGLEGFVEAIYPICVEVYGAPAFTNTVKIIYDETVAGLTGGVYDSTLNEIRIPALTDNTQANEVMVIRQMLHAFHDDAAFYYEQWEQGFAIAAADIILRQFDDTYDPSYGPLYVTNLYELLNRPGLGHDRIFGTGYDGMLTWRLGMASGAWSKCVVEDPRFFSKFNAAYYAQWAADPDVAGRIPALTSIAAGALPSVEGTTFPDWFRRQYALDTSVSLGDRLYVYNLPQENSVILILDYFTVSADGTERPRGGTAALEFWDYTYQFSLFVQEGYECIIPGVGTDAGQGFYIGSLYNIGGAQRLTVTLQLGAILQSVTFPYMVRGAEEGGNSFLGAMLGRDDGTVRVRIDGAEAEEMPVSQGAFGALVGGGESHPAKVVFEFEDADGKLVTQQVNTGFFFYAITPRMLQRQSLEHTFALGSNGLHLVSVPAYPVPSDDATVIGLPPSELLMATWDPSREGDNKYEIHPAMPPIIPGRGFWLKTNTSQRAQFEADVLPDDSEYDVLLLPGWNMLGNPSTHPVPLSQLGFDDGSGAVGFAQAVQNGLVRSAVYGYDQFNGYQETTALQPWEAVWVRCIKASGSRVIVPIAGTGETQTAAAQSLLPHPNWTVRLVASADEGPRSAVTLGVADDATDGFDALFDGEVPPYAPGQAVSLAVAAPDGTWLARDVRRTGQGAYDFAVRPAGLSGGTSINLTLEPGPSSPTGLRGLLVDTETGRTWVMVPGEPVVVPIASTARYRLDLEVGAP